MAQKWQAVITSVSNGFTVEFKGGDTPGTQVYEEKENPKLNSNETDKEHIVTMFYDILEHFGISESKHFKKRLFIEYKDNK